MKKVVVREILTLIVGIEMILALMVQSSYWFNWWVWISFWLLLPSLPLAIFCEINEVEK